MTSYKEGMEIFLAMVKKEYGAKFLSIGAESDLKSIWANGYRDGISPEEALMKAKETLSLEMYGETLGLSDTIEEHRKDFFYKQILGDAISVSNHPVMFK